MRIKYTASLRRKMITTVSASIMAALTSTAIAQEAEEATDEVVVTGIRQALESSLDIKRNAKGVVDSISAEDMGKFPDTNLAEALQRVTGVSIDRDQTSGEGKTITVRGFGADYNLVTLNGRTMPTSTLGNFASAPDTRSFDFGNLAPEAVSRVDIYKTAKSTTASGGVGSTIDIRTTRPLDAPGFNASVAFKNIEDESTAIGDNDSAFNNEISAIVYNTFLDDRIGVALTAIRNNNTHQVGSFRHQWSGFEAFGDTENSTPGNDEEVFDAAHFPADCDAAAHNNRDNCYPDGIYGDLVNGEGALTGQGLTDGTLMSVLNGSAGYYIDQLEQERDNFQLTFQARPVDALTLTADWTMSRLEHEVRSASLSVHNMDAPAGRYGIASNFLDTPGVATPTSAAFFKSQTDYGCDDSNNDGWNLASSFGEFWCAPGIDSVTNTVGYQNNFTEVESLGFNAEWDVNEALSLVFDFHNSSSESLPMSPYGSNAYIGSDATGHRYTEIDYTTEIPVITIDENHRLLDSRNPNYDGLNPTSRYLTGAGNVRAYMTNEIEQARVDGTYDLANTDFSEFVDVVKFGAAFTANKVTSGFGEKQAANWDGVRPPDWDNQFTGTLDGFPAGLYSRTLELQPFFSGLTGADQIFSQVSTGPYETWFGAYQTDYAEQSRLATTYGAFQPDAICNDNTIQGCSEIPYSTQREIREDVTAFYAELSKDLVILEMPASLVVGARYENTEVSSLNYTPEYGSLTVSGDKANAQTTGESLFLATEGSYDNFLPSIDFDIDVLEDVKVRASFSQTMTRQKYSDLAGGVVINPLLSVAKQNPNGYTGGGAEGNPNLEPFETDNIDLSAEWYYGDLSYLSVGYFSKKATGYVGQTNTYVPVQGLIHPTYNEEAIFNITQPNQSTREETIDGVEVALQHDFGDYSVPGVDLTGFGVILNATIVDTDAEYNNNVANSAHTGEFALVGISDSYNAAIYYDRFGLSARVAYSWRDKFLNFSGVSSGYTDEYDQVDANVSYSVPGTNLTITYDGINLNEEGRHTFERDNPAYTTWRSNGHAKHIVGVRWNY